MPPWYLSLHKCNDGGMIPAMSLAPPKPMLCVIGDGASLSQSFFHRDAIIGLGIGCVIGALSAPLLVNLGLALNVWVVSGVCLATSLSTWGVVSVGILLSTRIRFLSRLSKFAVVGGLSTLIELFVLNVLFLLTGVTTGTGYALFKTLTFCFGVTNSYIWNKYWSFASVEGNIPREFGSFLFVNIVGLTMNVSIASFIVNVIPAPFGFSGVLWGNIGALVAVVVTMIWNFTMYHFIVFKAHE